jgi:hypothetical protein
MNVRAMFMIFVAAGSDKDPTRAPEYYDGTYEYLRKLGMEEI